MRVDYFIYYRIDAEHEAVLPAAVASMQAALHAATGISGSVRRRLDDPRTWMEVYEGVSDLYTFEVELGSHVQRHGLLDFLPADGARHMERFRAP